MYNSITLVGHIGGEAKFETTNAGKSFCILSLATKRFAGGEKKSDWHKIIFWDEKKVEVVKNYTRVGSKILVSGVLAYNEWERDGVKQKSAEIHVGFGGAIELLDSKGQETTHAPTPAPVAEENLEPIPF
tara:strand:+ start:3832 stop:4221 length:390 start_codon:yes stop_codon:yes gene_type:complete